MGRQIPFGTQAEGHKSNANRTTKDTDHGQDFLAQKLPVKDLQFLPIPSKTGVTTMAQIYKVSHNQHLLDTINISS